MAVLLLDFLKSFFLDVLKNIFLSVPNALNKWRFRRFLGPHSLSGDNIYAVLDPYEHPLPRRSQPTNRYIKKFMGRKPNQPLIGEDKVLGVNVVRVVSHISATFSIYRGANNPIPVVTDEQIANQWDGTFICFGSSDSNIKTYDVENLGEQNFYTFDFDPKTGGRRFNMGGRSFIGGRYGILLRLRNPRHPEHYLFICAGQGEWGTSGAAYYLLHNWKLLYKRHKRKNFCKIIEVDIGSDESAREILSI